MNILFNICKLLHHILVDMKTTGCIDKHHILLVCFRMLDCCFRNIYRFLLISHGKYFHALFLTIDLQLCDSRRTVNITGNQERFLTFGLQLACKLRNCGGLTCTLQTCHHEHCDLISRTKRQLCCLTSHKFHKFIIYNLDHHLARIQTAHNVLSDCLLLYRFGKLLHNLKVYVSLQQGHLYFLKSKLNVLLCQAALASQLLKYILQFISQALKCHML